jgi:hypothetical protein
MDNNCFSSLYPYRLKCWIQMKSWIDLESLLLFAPFRFDPDVALVTLVLCAARHGSTGLRGCGADSATTCDAMLALISLHPSAAPRAPRARPYT